MITKKNDENIFRFVLVTKCLSEILQIFIRKTVGDKYQRVTLKKKLPQLSQIIQGFQNTFSALQDQLDKLISIDLFNSHNFK